jgi:hypothetical protein
MPVKKSSNDKRLLNVLFCLLPAVGLGACADYMKRRDTVTLSAGDSKAWNTVVHTTDPWPPYVRNTHIQGDGQRVARVTERYSTGGGPALPGTVSLPSQTSGAAPTRD